MAFVQDVLAFLPLVPYLFLYLSVFLFDLLTWRFFDLTTLLFANKIRFADDKKRKICIVGGGAAGMSCAWALARDPEKRFEVTLLESEKYPGGMATTENVSNSNLPGDMRVNDGVQGGATSYSNVLQILKMLDLEPNWLDVKVSFGVGERQWSNHEDSDKIKKHRKEIERFGGTLDLMDKFEALFVGISIRNVMKLFRYSEDFQNDIIFPLTALFFGTGNQTANVSSVIFAKVFTDPKLRLYMYDNERFLGKAPKMFAFPPFRDMYLAYKDVIEKTGCAKIITDAKVDLVEREPDGIRVDKNGKVQRGKGSVLVYHNGKVDKFDAIVFACNSETTEKILSAGSGMSKMEKFVMDNVTYYDDVTITHCDGDYMEKHYDMKKERNDMYFVKTYPEDRSKIEMIFDLSHYQPTAKTENGTDIYQSIFLNRSEDEKLWTRDQIDASKIVLTKWWRQFSHSVRHFVGAVPFWRFIQGHQRTFHAGSYTLVNTHEIATISGFAAAHRLGAPYPFPDDNLAVLQFDLYMSIIYGTKREEN